MSGPAISAAGPSVQTSDDPPLRAVLLATSDLAGGATRASYRLHEALRGAGVDSRLLVQDRRGDDPWVTEVARRPVPAAARAKAERGVPRLHRGWSSEPFHAAALPSRLSPLVRALHPDVVHLHWIAKGFLSVGDVGRLPGPLVWTLHDAWPFTGGCHYPAGCERYQARCGACPALGSRRTRDVSRLVWSRKHRLWGGLDLTVVAPSRWLAGVAGRSSLFAGRRVEVIPNAVDVDRFRPRDRAASRRRLGLPADRRLVLFGAMDSTSDPRKGFAHLQAALRRLAADEPQTELVVFGAERPAGAQPYGLPAHFLGTVDDEDTLAQVYAACDVFVAPSVQDNLPNTVVEALACGTPCVAFRIGGMPDLVAHRERGWLAEPFDADDLAAGIRWVVDDPARRARLGRAAREHALRTYARAVVAGRHRDLYAELAARQARTS